MTAKVVKLTVISDLICPWCYVGQLELESAIERVKALSSPVPLEFELEFRPFRLLTSLRDGDPPVNKKDFYLKKFGQEKFDNITQMVGERAKALGLTISWEGTMSQSTGAHRLLRKAWTLGGQRLQQPLIHRIFKAFLVDARDVGEVDLLAECAEKAGVMTKDEALEFLASDECLAEVNHMMADARAKGITGVPFTVINGKWAVSGGQSADVLVQIFTKLTATEGLTSTAMDPT